MTHITFGVILTLILLQPLQAINPADRHIVSPEARGLISFVPQYFIVNGMRMDIDRSINKNHWIQIAPMVFLANTFIDNNLAGDYYTDHKGAGLHLYHRYYPGKGFGWSPVYFSYGATWHFNHITYPEKRRQDSPEVFSSIHRVGADIIIGTFAHMFDGVFLDFYAGMGARHAMLNSEAENPVRFDQNYWSPGYTGAILILGVRIGFAPGKKH